MIKRKPAPPYPAPDPSDPNNPAYPDPARPAPVHPIRRDLDEWRRAPLPRRKSKSFLMNDIPIDLHTAAMNKCKIDQVPLRAVLLAALCAYIDGDITLYPGRRIRRRGRPNRSIHIQDTGSDHVAVIQPKRIQATLRASGAKPVKARHANFDPPKFGPQTAQAPPQAAPAREPAPEAPAPAQAAPEAPRAPAEPRAALSVLVARLRSRT